MVKVGGGRHDRYERTNKQMAQIENTYREKETCKIKINKLIDGSIPSAPAHTYLLYNQ